MEAKDLSDFESILFVNSVFDNNFRSFYNDEENGHILFEEDKSLTGSPLPSVKYELSPVSRTFELDFMPMPSSPILIRPQSTGSFSSSCDSEPQLPEVKPMYNVDLPEKWSNDLFTAEGCCQVCGEPAGKHTAYGGKVCPSCRAFFRRSVQTRYYEIFSCDLDEKCLINSKTRKSCKFCRFMKCVQAKMQISWVLSEKERDRRYNKLKKVGYRNEFHQQRRTNSDSLVENNVLAVALFPAGIGLAKTPVIQLTIEEQLHLENLRSYMSNVSKTNYEYFFTIEKACLNHLAQVSYFGGTMNYDYWKVFIDASDNFSQKMFFNLEFMKELNPNDQIALIRENGLPAYCYMESVYTDEEDPRLCICLDILQRLKLSEKKPVIRYGSIYKSPWAASHDDELRHQKLLNRMKAWALPSRGRTEGENGFDPLMTSLMRIQIGFSPYFAQLQQPEVCEKILQRYRVLLFRYIKFKFGDDFANAKFAEAMEMCATAREAAIIVRRRLPV